MAPIILYLIETYYDIAENHTDPRTEDWPMMSSPLRTLYFVVGYMLLIKFLSLQMKNRKPLEMRLVTIIYNIIQFVSCTWLLCSATGLIYKFSLKCEPTYEKSDPEVLMILDINWYFYIFRFLDFFSTIILVLRKQKVTLLHILYNSVVPIILWTGLKFIPDSHYTVGTYVNISVYTIMYLQNILEAIGKDYADFMSWKYNPAILLAYSSTIIVQSINSLQSDCYAAVPFGILVAIQNLLLFVILYKDAVPMMREMYNVDLMKGFSKFGEMCIPNQETLLQNNPGEEEITQKNE